LVCLELVLCFAQGGLLVHDLLEQTGLVVGGLGFAGLTFAGTFTLAFASAFALTGAFASGRGLRGSAGATAAVTFAGLVHQTVLCHQALQLQIHACKTSFSRGWYGLFSCP